MTKTNEATIEEAEFKDVPLPPEDPKDMVRQARELVPVTPTGIAPNNLAGLIEFAKAMMRARVALPDHMHENVGDCLAIIDIATRADLSPFMLAMQTYVDPKTKRLAFMSQAYHALCTPWLKGDFEVTYTGEGDELTCTISAVLKSDPQKMRSHTSPKLGEVRPKRNDQGAVKGSPLWDRKPKVQLFYDTSRDWVRLYCPRATLGIYTPDELAEYGPEMARDVTPASSGLSGRLRSGKVDRKEGHKTGVAEGEVAKAKNGGEKPKAEKRGKYKPKEPTNAMEWAEWAVLWIKEGTDIGAMRKRWAQERTMRNSCGVTGEQRGPVEKYLEDRCTEIDAAAQ
jgi:hypothetical protein